MKSQIALAEDFLVPVKSQGKLTALQNAIESRIVGQHDLVKNMLVCLLCDGHMLIEGMPGLAKTTAAKALAQGIEADFHRIQFTPDLLPSDIIGTEMYVHDKSSFIFRKGPLFNNILLADEINRAPAKVQSALLEAMGEKQVTVGHHTYQLPELYMVLATQNPIENEGTYTLPEAQLDRFLMHVIVDYPTHEEELRILSISENGHGRSKSPIVPVTHQEEIRAARQAASDVFIDDRLREYIVALVGATRRPAAYGEKVAKLIRHGASPRASLALVKSARALAWLNGSRFVTPHHIQQVALPVLRHRIIPSFEAEAEGISRTRIVKQLLELVAIP